MSQALYGLGTAIDGAQHTAIAYFTPEGGGGSAEYNGVTKGVVSQDGRWLDLFGPHTSARIETSTLARIEYLAGPSRVKPAKVRLNVFGSH